MSEVLIQIDKRHLIGGFLDIPKEAMGIVVFAHGSGSGRYSKRNQYVAKVLREGGLGTLLIDLLTRDEEQIDEVTRSYRFDIPFLAQRLIDVTNWLKNQEEAKTLSVGYFGASTGAAAALIAAAELSEQIKAVVSRGGRPDLAMTHLKKLAAPTLLLVGGYDYDVIELNKMAYEAIDCEKVMKIIPGATHLFDEPGTLERVAEEARDWFQKYLYLSHPIK